MAIIEVKIPNWLDRIFAWPAMVYRRRKYGYEFRRIYLGEEVWTIVEPADYYRVGNIKWCLGGHERFVDRVRVVCVAACEQLGR